MQAISINYNVLKLILYLFCIGVVNLQCQENTKYKFIYSKPVYANINLVALNDTLDFKIDSTTYNEIKSFNYFINTNKEYISLYDKHSQTISIFDFQTQALLNKMPLLKLLPNRDLYKATVFVKNFDSIFISSALSLYILDTNYRLVDSFSLPTNPYVSLASFTNTNPIIFNGKHLYFEARPRLKHTEKRDLKKWRVLFDIDLATNQIKIDHSLPDLYKKEFLSYLFFYPGYCYNKDRRFVFSFPADTNVYETDLKNYNVAYNAKSRLQKNNIQPATVQDLTSEDGTDRLFLLSDSYGGIFFDPIKQRYLRISQQKITEKQYKEKIWKKQQSVIVMNKEFIIEGESEIDQSINLNSLFFTKDGSMYARTLMNDENHIYFVRMAYLEPK